MFLQTQSELMLNQKHAEIMAPDLQFEVLQTSSGEALFFSIATDDVLYVTREISASNTGWTGKTDISSALKTFHNNERVIAKSFSLSQNPATMSFDIALVISVAGEDFLYMSLNHANTEDAWKNGITWTYLPFDATNLDRPKKLVIADVYLMNVVSVNSGSDPIENCFVDVLRDPNHSLKLLDRYYVTPDGRPRWAKQGLAIDLREGSISSCLGYIQDDPTPGIYTYGMIKNKRELAFKPQFNAFDRDIAPTATIFSLPAKSSAIASSLDRDGYTNLFVAAASGLHLFTTDNQSNGSKPIKVVASSTHVSKTLFAGVSRMTASSNGSRTVVWCLNAQNQLFYVSCSQGSEADASAWSQPVPICSGAEGFSFFLNNAGSYNDVFAHMSGQQLIRFTQDPSTEVWSQRPILLPPPDIDNLREVQTFTTTLSVVDNNKSPLLNQDMSLVCSTMTAVYINDTYFKLDPDIPITISTGTTGRVTIVQETASLSANTYQITLPGSAAPILLDPASKVMGKLSAIQSGADLSEVNVPTPDGQTRPLLPDDVSDADRDAVANVVQKLMDVHKQLPADGSTVQTARVSTRAIKATKGTVGARPKHDDVTSFGIVFEDTGFKYHEARHDLSATDGTSVRTTSVSHAKADPIKYLKTKAGDLFQWVKDTWESVESVVIKAAGDAWAFIVKIGGEFWGAILDSAAVVAEAIMFVFNKIKVFFEDLVAWVGFLFQWKDIVRTHKVLKNVLKQNCRRVVESIDKLEGQVKSTFKDIERQMSSWGNLKDDGKTVGQRVFKESGASEIDSPQTNWGVHHAENGMRSASVTKNPAGSGLTAAVSAALATLEGMIAKEEQALRRAVTQIKEEVAEKFNSLTAVQIIKKVIAIVGTLITTTAETIIIGLLDLIKLLIKSTYDLLDAPIRIPVISKVYKSISGGNELSVLDLMCLVAAIPVTIIHKVTKNKAPFPDDSHTQALINAPDFRTLKTLLTGNNARSHKADITGASKPDGTTHGLKPTAVKARANPSPELLTIITASLNVAALVGERICTICNVIKFGGSAGTPVNVVSAIAYLFYVGPNITSALADQGQWANIFNDLVTVVSIAKALVDASPLSKNETWSKRASPWIEMVINICWLVPALAVFITGPKNKPSDYLGLIANLAFDIGGILSPMTSDKIVSPKVAAIGFITQTGCNATCGWTMLGNGITLFLGH